MSQLNQETIAYLTRLSRIDCSDEEQKKLLIDLKKILAYVDQLQEVDTEDVAPCNQVLENTYNVMREDIPEEPLSRELFLTNAPSHIGGMIRIPPVFKEN